MSGDFYTAEAKRFYEDGEEGRTGEAG